jgi:uncharacterized caspase-like protein
VAALALVVASDRYDDPALQRLRGPVRDAEELASTLADPAVGGFDVRTMLNEPAHLIAEEIEGFFRDRMRDDLLLLYFSCHGVKDDAGRLYFATTSTKLNRLAATGVASSFVGERMDHSRSRKIVLLLDCCYSGAFARGLHPRAGQSVDVQERFDGQGRIVITASTAMEYAFELEVDDGVDVTGGGTPSLFTSSVVRGLRTGAADLDGDGRISVDELYDYVFAQVRARSSSQTPSMFSSVQGELYIARSPGSAQDTGTTRRDGAVPVATRADAARPAPAAPAAEPERQPDPVGPPPETGPPARLRPVVLAGLAVLLVVAALLAGRALWVGEAPTALVPAAGPTAANGSVGPSPPQGTVPPSAAPPSAAGDGAVPGVLSQGAVTLSGGLEGLDLISGQVVPLPQSSLAYGGLTDQLLIWDETTSGATVLAGTPFDDVDAAELASLTYGRGADNPPLSRSDVPAGSLVAVHVRADTYAKVQVVEWEQALTLQWVTFGTG